MNALATSTPMLNGNAGAGGSSDAATGNKKPKGVIEKMYQKKSQLEHILLRPDTYIGSVEHVKEPMWVFDKESQTMIQKEIEYVPGLYKIYDEILVNAADNKQRDPKMDCIKINIDAEANEISVWNNGKGIPVVEHKDEKMFVPTMIFGHLLTSSNYNDDEKKVTGGRNGYGAKLCNIFSTKFSVETASKEYKKKFKQSWSNNMTKTSAPTVKDSSEDFTKITFSPDLAKFHMTSLDNDIVDLMSRRAYDIAASTRGVKVFLNGERIPVKSFKDYVDLFLKDKLDDGGNPLKVVYECVSPRWEIAVTVSEKNFQQMSFVNSIATTKGGRHVDYVADQIIKNLVAIVNKRNKETQIKPFQVKNHLWLFVNCLIENPTFDSQTKENMTLQAKNFGSTCKPSEKFTQAVAKCGITDAVLQWARFKAQSQLQKTSGKKQSKLKGVPKLEDANDAGTKNSIDCTLILTEGDSAKTLAVSGLGVVGRDRYGVFPLRGKLLNVREASTKQIMENAEISAIVKIVGLQYKKKYETREDLKQLRYGKLMIMTDQDQDGSHIKGLIINFIHHNWPSLLKLDFLEEFITPIIKATRKVGRHNDEVLSFFSLPEFEEWKNNTPNWNRFTIKYYKGLGTSTSAEAKEYFSNMQRHRIKFKYESNDDDSHITMAFSKKMVEARKDWLNSWMSEVKRRKELGLGEDYLYAKNTRMVTYKDFINKELVLYSNMDNERSIPSMVDGLKPGSRKVLFTCLKRNLTKELKVAQLAGSVAELSAYHHGETSLMTTIINLAQNFVGSNNINLLKPNGQFGTRLQGGKDAASPRYIFTQLGPMTRLIFHPHDDPLLNYLRDDNLKIEPEWYIPIIPMVLVNGADGIGTGWMTKIPNHNPREIIQNLQRMIRGEDPIPMKPWYKNFLGEIEKLGETRFITNGEVGIVSDEKIEITELPIGTWTQTYKENVLEAFLAGGDKAPITITNYKEYNTDATVKFQVFLSKENLKKAELDGLHKIFKLQSTLSTSSMCAFDRHGVLRQYDSATQILREFFDVRLEFYNKRKAYLSGMLEAEANKLTNQARFIVEKCDGDLRIENRKKKEMIAELQRRNYPGDPVRTWKLRIDRESALEEEAPQNTENEENTNADEDAPESDPNLDYDYLLGMKMWSLTLEKKNELLKKRDEKQAELDTLKKKSPSDLWQEDLDALLAKMEEIEQEEKEAALYQKPVKGAKGGKDARKKVMVASDSLPSPHAIRVIPKIDELLKKAEKLDQARENKGKRTKKVKDDTEPKAEGEVTEKKPKSEGEGVEKKTKAVKEKKPRKERAEKNSPKKRGGKKNLSESDDDFTASDADSDFEPARNVTPVRSTSRRSAAPRSYRFDDDDEDESKSSASDNEPTEYFDNDAVKENEDGPMVVSSLDESEEVGTSKKKKQTAVNLDSDKDDSFHLDDSDSFTKKKTTTNKKPITLVSTDDASDDEAAKSKAKRTRKPAAKTTKNISDDDSFDNSNDDDDSDDLFGNKKKPAKKATKAPAKKKEAPKRAKEPAKKLPITKSKPAAKKTKIMDSDDDFSDHVETETKKTTKRKTAPTTDSSDEDFAKFKSKESNDADLTTDEKFDLLLGKKEPPKRAATKTKSEYSFEPSEVTYDSDEEYNPSEEKKTKGGAKKTTKRPQKKKKVSYSSDEDSDFF